MFSNNALDISHAALRLRPSTRFQSTALHFYQNKQLEYYASKEAKRLTLRQLMFFGRSMTEDRLIKSANYVRTELPVRIALRLRDLQALPYVVVTQEGVAKVYEMYWSAFEKFRKYPPILNLEDNEKYCLFVKQLLHEHATVIPNLSLGLSLASPHLLPEQLDNFMRRMLVSRISRRVLAQHHIALSESFSGKRKQDQEEPHVGIIFTGLNVRRSVEKCARILRRRLAVDDSNQALASVHRDADDSWPEVIIDGYSDTKFAYIREHLEYIVLELLKNSMDATCKQYHDSPYLPPIRVTIVSGENDITIRISDQGGGLLTPSSRIKSSEDLFSFSHVRNAGRMEQGRIGALRTRSLKGMHATVEEQVDIWDKVTAVAQSGSSVQNELHPRLGIGLPMSNIFATYFGGSLSLVSVDGWGTDVYLRLPKLGTNLEGIEV